MGIPEPREVEQANVRFHAFLFIGQAYWKWRLQAHLVIHTLGFYNIKSGSGIYKAVTDRPIRYKNRKLIISYNRIVPLVGSNVYKIS